MAACARPSVARSWAGRARASVIHTQAPPVTPSRRAAAAPRSRRGISTPAAERTKAPQWPLLLCPGPVRVPAGVLEELGRQCVPHREAEFRAVYRDCQERSVKILKGRQGDHFAAWTTGSGTCAVEIVISSYLSSRRTLVLSGGSFGERWQEVCRIWGVPFTVMNVGKNSKPDLQQLQLICAEQNIQSVLVVHHETSTGVVTDLVELNKALCAAFPAGEGPDMCVDAVSSFGAEDIDLNVCDRVNFVMFGANKGLEAPPGTCCVAGKREAFEALGGKSAPTPRSYYMDLNRLYRFAKIHETATTPAVNTFFSTREALRQLEDETLQARRSRMLELTRRIRNRMSELGYSRVLPHFFSEQDMSSYLTNFYYPGISAGGAANADMANKFHGMMEENGIFLYRGKDDLLNMSFQVCTMGEVAESDVEFFLEQAAACQKLA